MNSVVFYIFIARMLPGTLSRKREAILLLITPRRGRKALSCLKITAHSLSNRLSIAYAPFPPPIIEISAFHRVLPPDKRNFRRQWSALHQRGASFSREEMFPVLNKALRRSFIAPSLYPRDVNPSRRYPTKAFRFYARISNTRVRSGKSRSHDLFFLRKFETKSAFI